MCVCVCVCVCVCEGVGMSKNSYGLAINRDQNLSLPVTHASPMSIPSLDAVNFSHIFFNLFLTVRVHYCREL